MKKIGVQLGHKRGPYKRSKRKNEVSSNYQEDGMTYLEISKALNIPVKEVKKIEKLALRKLKKPTEVNQKFHSYCNIPASER